MAAPTAESLQALHDLDLGDLAFALRFLNRYGYLTQEATPATVAAATIKFQEAYGVPPQGVLDHPTLEAMWAPRCGLRDDSYTEAAKWRKKDLRWWLDQALEGVPGLSRLDQLDLIAQGLAMYQDTVDVSWKPATSRSQADLLVGVGSGRQDGFDGNGGVLAWCELPNGSDRAITMKFDRGDTWLKTATGGRGILYANVFNHEAGHGHGMNHITGPVALLNPYYNERVGVLLAPDVQALLALGYSRATVPPPPPPSPGAVKIVLTGDLKAGTYEVRA